MLVFNHNHVSIYMEEKKKKKSKVQRKVGVHVPLRNTKPYSSLRAKRCSPFPMKKKTTSPWQDRQKGVSDLAGCNVCLRLNKATECDIRFAVTHWRPRFQIVVGEASCPGGEGQKPAPSGRCLVYEGSPASSACGGTSSDPKEVHLKINE